MTTATLLDPQMKKAVDPFQKIEASLFVPNNVAGAEFVVMHPLMLESINPPPPTAASMVPAQNAKNTRLRISSHSINTNSINSTNVLAQDAFYL